MAPASERGRQVAAALSVYLGIPGLLEGYAFWFVSFQLFCQILKV
jgi:hypothetical protein